MVAARLINHAPLSDHCCKVAFFASCVCAISGKICQIFGRDPNYLAAHKSYQVLCYCGYCTLLNGKGCSYQTDQTGMSYKFFYYFEFVSYHN
jgi:hypothetical protein